MIEAPPDVATGDTFERLIEQARSVHDLEVAALRMEVAELRREAQALRGSMLASGGGDGQLLKPTDQPALSGDHMPASGGDGQLLKPAGQPALCAAEACSPNSADFSSAGVLADLRPSLTSDTSQSQLSPVSPCSQKPRRGLTGSLHHRMKIRQFSEGLLSRIVHHPAFEMFIAVMTIANGVAIAAEAQYNGTVLARRTGHPSGGGMPSGASSELADAAFNIVDCSFGVLFIVEVFMRIGAAPVAYLKQAWGWVDIFISIMWLLGMLTEYFEAQVLRLARLARLMRLMRLLKHMKGHHFDSLYLMATALSGSLSVLMWAFLLMFLVHSVLALAINQGLRELFFDSDPAKAAGQVEVFEYFGSFSRAFLTMFEISLANWPVPCRVLVEQVSEWFVVYTIVHKMTLGFAVIGIINAVFVQETFKVASADNHVMVKQSMDKQRLHRERMVRLFEEADEDEDGRVSLEEWQQICQDDWVKAWLASQDVSVSDAAKLYNQLDNGDGALTADELIQGTARLKGPAQAMYVMETVSGMDKFLRQFKDELFAQRPVMSEHCGCRTDIC